MNFINEHISTEDVLKYDLGEIDKRYVVGGTSSRSWTIDRKRNIYLRMVSRGREEFSHISNWTFFWKGQLIEIEIATIEARGGPGEDCWAHKRVTKIVFPSNSKLSLDDVARDLEDALLAYKDNGVFSVAKKYDLMLEINARGEK